jgi:hypothetical protein
MQTKKNFCPICDAEVDIPADLLAGMAASPANIASAVRAAGGDPEGWSASEIAAHMADIEVGLGWRIRQVLAEDAPMLQPFDQDVWADVLLYKQRDPQTSLAAYAAERALNVEILGRLDDAGWQRMYRHPEFGNRPLRVLVEHIADHDLAHLRQIRGG